MDAQAHADAGGSGAVIDIFDMRATPGARQTRPALFRARMNWAERAIRAAHEEMRTVSVGGIAVGDRVKVRLPGDLWLYGEVMAWERGGDTGSLVLTSMSVARVRLETAANVPEPIHFYPRTRLQPAPRPVGLA